MSSRVIALKTQIFDLLTKIDEVPNAREEIEFLIETLIDTLREEIYSELLGDTYLPPDSFEE